jgi:hypothetical protein
MEGWLKTGTRFSWFIRSAENELKWIITATKVTMATKFVGLINPLRFSKHCTLQFVSRKRCPDISKHFRSVVISRSQHTLATQRRMEPSLRCWNIAAIGALDSAADGGGPIHMTPSYWWGSSWLHHSSPLPFTPPSSFPMSRQDAEPNQVLIWTSSVRTRDF